MVLFMEGIRSLKFAGVSEPVTCSIGVCFLPENIPGYSCEYMEGKRQVGAASGQEEREESIRILRFSPPGRETGNAE